MTGNNAIASVAVRNLKSALVWYERLLGKPADSRPIDEVAEWRFERGGRLQFDQPPERAGNCSTTLVVRDIENQALHLRKCNIADGERTSSA
jgi:hypothetical protein